MMTHLIRSPDNSSEHRCIDQDGAFKLDGNLPGLSCRLWSWPGKAFSLLHEFLLLNWRDIIVTLGNQLLEGVREWMHSGAFLWPALKWAIHSEKRLGRCIPEAGRSSMASGWGGEGTLLYPCRDESQSRLPCARFKLATHRDETRSIPFLKPGVICPLEDRLPRWKQGDGHSEMR